MMRLFLKLKLDDEYLAKVAGDDDLQFVKKSLDDLIDSFVTANLREKPLFYAGILVDEWGNVIYRDYSAVMVGVAATSLGNVTVFTSAGHEVVVTAASLDELREDYENLLERADSSYGEFEDAD